VNVTASTATPPGSYPFTVTITLGGGSGSRTHSTTGTLVVE
jgi:hypothetical protein